MEGAMPAEIRRLANLRKLNISYNQFTGLPAELGQLKNLVELDVSYNRLTGLPYELGNLTSLKRLVLTGNNYSEQDLAVILKTLPNVQVVR
jgi:Leucine-rich repeat (LRR) protein